jgi:hypothetical protein
MMMMVIKMTTTMIYIPRIWSMVDRLLHVFVCCFICFGWFPFPPMCIYGTFSFYFEDGQEERYVGCPWSMGLSGAKLHAWSNIVIMYSCAFTKYPCVATNPQIKYTNDSKIFIFHYTHLEVTDARTLEAACNRCHWSLWLAVHAPPTSIVRSSSIC